MAFNQVTFAPISSGSTPAPSTFTYISDEDLIGDIAGADYFEAKVNQLRVGDMIFGEGTDGAAILVYRGPGITCDVITGTTGTFMPEAPATGQYVAQGDTWSSLYGVAPYLNIIRTQDETNDVSLTGTGVDTIWPPATPQPLTGGNYEGYRKIGNLVSNKELGLTLIDGDDETGAALTACDIPITEAGTYRVDGFTTFRHPANNSTVAFVFAVELGGQYIFSQRPVKATMPNGGRNANLAGEGILSVPAGAVLSMWVASDNTGVIEFNTLSALVVKFADL